MRTSTEKTDGISMVVGGEDVTMGEDMDRGDRVGKEEPLSSRVCSGNQSSMCSMERGQVAHLGVATLEERVLGDKDRDVKIVVDVKDGELMMCNKWCCR